MYIYGKITETYLKENHKIFDEALETTMLIYNYFESIGDCINYAYDGNQTYTFYQTNKNSYITVLAMDIYTDPRQIWRKKPASEKNGQT